jgi:hypothetical protein
MVRYSVVMQQARSAGWSSVSCSQRQSFTNANEAIVIRSTFGLCVGGCRCCPMSSRVLSCTSIVVFGR